MTREQRAGATGWSLLRRSVIRASEEHAAVDVASLLNVFLDAVPRIEIRSTGAPGPAFRTAGLAGFSAGLFAAIAAALAGSRPMDGLAIAIAIAVVSFFLWAHIRRAIAGVECLVLIEHVWVALLAAAIALRLLHLPVAATLDPLCAGLAFFLAGGRAGCLMAGCCHGHPSTVGLCYPTAHAAEGFPEHLTGIRLFPVQLLELAGLLLIGATTFLAVPLAPSGSAAAWFLLSYALLRFSLEGLRGDDRPYLWSMSVPRWMCLAEFSFVAAAALHERALPVIAVTAALTVYLGRDTGRRLLDSGHLTELRTLLDDYRSLDNPPTNALAWSTSQRVTLAISHEPHRLNISLCLPHRQENLSLAAQLAASAFPQLDPNRALYAGGNVLHFALSQETEPVRSDWRTTYRRLYRTLLLQRTPAPVPLRQHQPAPSAQPAPWYWIGTGMR
jgi:hypothetical protein